MILRHACVLLLMVATPAVLMAQRGPLVTETEPNNSFAAAQLIPFGDTVSAYIDNHPDIDYFAVDIPAGTKFFLTIERSFCMGLGMYGPDQQTVILSRNCYSEHADTMHALIEHSGRYYFRVMHDDDRPNEVQDPPLPYKLGFGVYTAPAPGPGNPLAHVATDEGGISAMVPAPNGGVVFIDVMVDASDHQHTRLRRMTPDGRISTIASDLNPMGQIAVDAFGDVLVPSEDGVWRYSLVTGARTLFTGRSSGAFPYAGITIGADGDVWLSDPGTFEAGAVFSRFDPFGNLKEKVPIPVGRVFYLTTAQNGDVFFQTQDVGDIYRLVNNATPQRVVTASTPDAGQGSLLLDQDGWIYLPKTRQGRVRLYDAQYHLARDPLAQVLDSMYWANQHMSNVMSWIRDSNGRMTARLLVLRGPGFYEHLDRTYEILELSHAAMGAAGADPMLHVAQESLTAGAVTVSYADTLHVSGTSGSASWSVVAGSLPAGLSLGPDGVISGTPGQTGNSEFTVKATDGPRAGFGRFSITVTAAPAVVVSLPDVVAALLGGPAVSNAVAEYLDQQGNKNGKLDVGDLRAYLRAQGKLGGVSTP